MFAYKHCLDHKVRVQDLVVQVSFGRIMCDNSLQKTFVEWSFKKDDGYYELSQQVH